MNKMTPPIKDLLPRLTPILKNRYEIIHCFRIFFTLQQKVSRQVHVMYFSSSALEPALIADVLSQQGFYFQIIIERLNFTIYYLSFICFHFKDTKKSKKIVLIWWGVSLTEGQNTWAPVNGWESALNCWIFWRRTRKPSEEPLSTLLVTSLRLSGRLSNTKNWMIVKLLLRKGTPYLFIPFLWFTEYALLIFWSNSKFCFIFL